MWVQTDVPLTGNCYRLIFLGPPRGTAQYRILSAPTTRDCTGQQDWRHVTAVTLAPPAGE